MKKVLLSATMVLVGASLVACSADKHADNLVKIENKGKIVVAMSPEFAPFEFKTLVKGKDTIVGADIELAKAIGEELKVDVEFSAMSFDNVLASLKSGKADIAISGISATKERQKAYDFSDSYYESKNVIMVQKAKIQDYKGFKDFDNQAVVVQKGSIQEKIAKDNFKGANITPLTKVGEMVAEVSNGKAQALVLEEAIAKGYAEKNKNLAISTIELPSDDADAYAIAMPKGSKKLTKKVNEVIKSLKKEDKINTFVQEAYDLSVKE
ncbi:transporter substrate-binding domain-containing protein [Streptococcus thoraltensis]|uniref:transporter substrate-binding domain-containing protein n=1 Tax=Streptococcus thoraltensis TaxID=55085 RepID=UPI00036506A1|nr:transporter substrate-binding domain-containing protein [Streptococcus thoraltensis]MDY4760596.1 transporter substrate-binding domain-containing protein [Streptococcus thoraltensis]